MPGNGLELRGLSSAILISWSACCLARRRQRHAQGCSTSYLLSDDRTASGRFASTSRACCCADAKGTRVATCLPARQGVGGFGPQEPQPRLDAPWAQPSPRLDPALQAHQFRLGRPDPSTLGPRGRLRRGPQQRRQWQPGPRPQRGRAAPAPGPDRTPPPAQEQEPWDAPLSRPLQQPGCRAQGPDTPEAQRGMPDPQRLTLQEQGSGPNAGPLGAPASVPATPHGRPPPLALSRPPPPHPPSTHAGDRLGDCSGAGVRSLEGPAPLSRSPPPHPPASQPGNRSGSYNGGGAHGWVDPKQLTWLIGRCGCWQQLADLVAANAAAMNAVHVTAVATRLTHLQPPPLSSGTAPSAAPPHPAPAAATGGGDVGGAGRQPTAAATDTAGAGALRAGPGCGSDEAQRRGWHELLRSVLGLVELHGASLDARGVANISWALAKLAAGEPAASNAAGDDPDSVAGSGAVETDATADACGDGAGAGRGAAEVAALRAAVRGTVSRLLSLPGGAADPVGMSPQHVSNTLWAIASLGLGPTHGHGGNCSGGDGDGDGNGRDDGACDAAGARWATRALPVAQRMLAADRFSEAGLSQLIFSVCDMGLAPDAAWTAAFYGAARRRAAEFNALSASNVLLALARMAGGGGGGGSAEAPMGPVGAAGAERHARRGVVLPLPADRGWLDGFLADTAGRLAEADGAALCNNICALTVLLEAGFGVTETNSSGGSGSGGGGGTSSSSATGGLRRWLACWYAALQGVSALHRMSDAHLARSLWYLATLCEALPGEPPLGPPPALLAAAAAALAPRFASMPAQSFAMAGCAMERLRRWQQQLPPPQQEYLLHPQHNPQTLPSAWHRKPRPALPSRHSTSPPSPPQPPEPEPSQSSQTQTEPQQPSQASQWPQPEAPWHRNATWLRAWAAGAERCMLCPDTAWVGLLLILRSAAGWGPAAGAAGVGHRWLGAALRSALRPAHRHQRPRLLVALLCAAEACLSDACPEALLDAVAAVLLEESGAGGGGGGPWDGGDGDAPQEAVEARTEAEAGPWTAAAMLYCGAALARAGYAPPPAWRRAFFARVLQLAELSPSSPTPSAAAGDGAAAATALPPPPRQRHRLSGGEVGLLLQCSRRWGARPSDATLAALLYGLPYGEWGPQDAAHACRELALLEATRGSGIQQLSSGPQHPPALPQASQQPPMAQRAPSAAGHERLAAQQPVGVSVAAGLAEPTDAGRSPGPEAAEVRLAQPSVSAAWRGQDGTANRGGALNGNSNGSAPQQPMGPLNGEAVAALSPLAAPGADGSGGRTEAVLQRGPGRPPGYHAPPSPMPALPLTLPPPLPVRGPVTTAQTSGAVGPSTPWPAASNSSSNSSTSGDQAGGGGAANAYSGSRPALPVLAGPSPSRQRSVAVRFFKEMLDTACQALLLRQLQQGQQKSLGTPPHTISASFAAAALGEDLPPSTSLDRAHSSADVGTSYAGIPSLPPLDRPWPLNNLDLLLSSATQLRLPLRRWQKRALAIYLSHQLLTLPQPRDLFPLLWRCWRLGVPLGPPLAAALDRRALELSPASLSDQQLFMVLEAMAGWRVAPPPDWALQVPGRLLRWIRKAARRPLDECPSDGSERVAGQERSEASRQLAGDGSGGGDATASPGAGGEGQRPRLAPDVALVWRALRALQYMQLTVAPSLAAANAVGAEGSSAVGEGAGGTAAAAGGLPATTGDGKRSRGVKSQRTRSQTESPLTSPDLVMYYWPGMPQLLPSLREATRQHLTRLFGLSLPSPTPASVPAGAESPAPGTGVRAVAAAPPHLRHAGSPRERLSALCCAHALGLLTYNEWASWGVVALLRLAPELPPTLYPAWLQLAARMRGLVARATLEDMLLGFCAATAPGLEALKPRALHATLLAAGHLAAALRVPLSRDWASAALRRYSRCCGALPPPKYAQVPAVLRRLRRLPPPAWQVAYAAAARARLPRMAPERALSMMHEGAALSPELGAMLQAVLRDHVQERRRQQELLQQQQLRQQQRQAPAVEQEGLGGQERQWEGAQAGGQSQEARAQGAVRNTVSSRVS